MSKKVNLGRVAYVNRGAYDSTTTYEKHDVVTYNNGSYVFIGSMSAAGKEPTDSGYWMPMLDPTSVNEATDRANAAAEAAEEATANIQNEVNSKAVAISETASGDVVHITNCGAAPVQSLVTHIEPVQSGTGDPSPDNVRPISGWESVSVTGAGKNLVNWAAIGSKTNGGVTFTNNGDGTFAVSGETADNAANTDRLTIYLQPGQYKIDSGNDTVLAQIRINRNGTVSNKQNTTFTIYGDETSLMVNLAVAKNKTVSGIVYPLLTMADDAGDYEPYQGKTLTADLPETVYGGTLDWTTGVLTVDEAIVAFTGTETWRAHGTIDTTVYMTTPSGIASAVACSHYKVAAVSSNDLSVNIGTQLNFRDSVNAVDVDTWTAYLAAQVAAGTPVTLACKIKKPYTIQLTPQQLSTLKGVNNIWSDAGTTEVVYTLDTRTYIDRVEEKIQALSAVVAPSIFVDASGDMVHITDGAESMPVQRLITHVEPKETGEGEKSPANPWTIIGWDEVSATRTGKNLLPEGTMSFVAKHSVYFNPPLPPGTYTISGLVTSDDTDDTVSAVYYYSNGVSLTKSNFNRGVKEIKVLTFEKEVDMIVFFSSRLHSASAGDACQWEEVQLEVGSTATAYEPYQGKTLTADLPETVYGGTLDWTTGVLTVDRTCELLLNDGGWVQGKANPNYYTNHNYGKKMYYERNDKSTLICTHGVWMATNATPVVGTPSGCVYGYHKTWIGMTSDYSTLDEFAAWLDAQEQAGTPVTVVYKLATPYTIQLTPQQLSTLKGVNNIWSDAGATEVTYAADTKMYIDNKIAAIAAAIV